MTIYICACVCVCVCIYINQILKWKNNFLIAYKSVYSFNKNHFALLHKKKEEILKTFFFTEVSDLKISNEDLEKPTEFRSPNLPNPNFICFSVFY